MCLCPILSLFNMFTTILVLVSYSFHPSVFFHLSNLGSCWNWSLSQLPLGERWVWGTPRTGIQSVVFHIKQQNTTFSGIWYLGFVDQSFSSSLCLGGSSRGRCALPCDPDGRRTQGSRWREWCWPALPSLLHMCTGLNLQANSAAGCYHASSTLLFSASLTSMNSYSSRNKVPSLQCIEESR